MDDFAALEALAVDVSSPVRMPLILPNEVDPIADEDGTQGYLEFLPLDSDESRKLDRRNHVETVKKGFRQRSMADMRKEAEAEDPVEQQVDRLVALITGWHLVGPDRKQITLPFSKENARKLFENPKFGWLRRRAYGWVLNEANFMKSSPRT